MDTNDLRAVFTVLTLVTFLAIVWWAYGSKRQQAFDEAAQLPFTDDDELDAGSKPAIRHQ